MNLKIKISIIIFLSAISFSCVDGKIKKSKKPKRTSLEEYNLKGRVSSIREFSYTAQEKNGKIQKLNPNSTMLYIFNNNGNILDFVVYNDDSNSVVYAKGAIVHKYTYKYNNKQNLIMEISKHPNSGFSNSVKKYKYDNQGNLLEMSEFDSDNGLIEKDIYKYDWNSNLKEKTEYDSNEVLKQKHIYKYDDKGNKIEELVYDSDMNLDRNIFYRYDKEGNIISKTSINSSGISTASEKYDSNGNKIELISCDPDGRLAIKYNFEYNLNGDEIVFKNYIAMTNYHQTYFSKYEYDKYGNWIKRIKYNKQNQYLVIKHITLTEREIEYF